MTIVYEETNEAQRRFGGAKGISSDQFYERDRSNFDDSRIDEFSNASGISSDQYFGRSKRDSNSLPKLANLDIKSGKQVIQDVGDKLSDMLKKLQG